MFNFSNNHNLAYRDPFVLKQAGLEDKRTTINIKFHSAAVPDSAFEQFYLMH